MKSDKIFRLEFLLILIIFNLLYIKIFSQNQPEYGQKQQYFYPNGKLSSEGYLKDGKPDGYWKSYYENGKLKSEGGRKNFELDSLWKFYNEKGLLTLEIMYKNGKKNGIRSSYFEKEIIRENFVNDIKEGFTRYFYSEGVIKQDIPFVKGLEQGLGREYDRGGIVVTLTEYKQGFIVERTRINRKDGNGRKQGRWFVFYENGNIRTEGNYRDDKKDGFFKEYTESGDLVRISKYINGVIEPEAVEVQKLDIQNEYYPDGKIKVSAMFRNGKPEGIRREFSEEGKIEKSILYQNGIVTGEGIMKENGDKDGFWKEFYSEGMIKAEGRYDNGRQTGEWKFYHRNGKTEQTGRFNKQGKPEGIWRWYFDTGQMAREESYHNGLRDGLSITYDETGKVIEEGEFLNGNEEGSWYEYIGDTYIKGTYRDGLRNGRWSYYYLNDTLPGDSLLYYKGNFTDDLPDGKHVEYWDNGKIRDEGLYLMGRKEGDWMKYNYDGTLFMIITYRDGVEIRFDGIRIKPPFEKEED